SPSSTTSPCSRAGSASSSRTSSRSTGCGRTPSACSPRPRRVSARTRSTWRARGPWCRNPSVRCPARAAPPPPLPGAVARECPPRRASASSVTGRPSRGRSPCWRHHVVLPGRAVALKRLTAQAWHRRRSRRTRRTQSRVRARSTSRCSDRVDSRTWEDGHVRGVRAQVLGTGHYEVPVLLPRVVARQAHPPLFRLARPGRRLAACARGHGFPRRRSAEARDAKLLHTRLHGGARGHQAGGHPPLPHHPPPLRSLGGPPPFPQRGILDPERGGLVLDWALREHAGLPRLRQRAVPRRARHVELRPAHPHDRG